MKVVSTSKVELVEALKVEVKITVLMKDELDNENLSLVAIFFGNFPTIRIFLKKKQLNNPSPNGKFTGTLVLFRSFT